MSARKKRKKGLIITAVVVVAVVALVVLMPKNTEQALAFVNTEALSRTDLKQTVSVTGSVVSDNEGDVYAKLAGIPMKTVNVEVGDKVKEGDVLALFDTESIEDSIARQQATMNQTAAASQQQIKLAEKQRQNLQEDFETGHNFEQAQNQINGLRDSLTNAQYEVDHFGDKILETARDVGEENLDDETADQYEYVRALRSYRTSVEDVESAQQQLEKAKAGGNADQIAVAQERLDTCQKELERSKTVYDMEIIHSPSFHHNYELLETALRQAQDQYDLAVKSFDDTWTTALRGLDSAQDNVDTSVISSNQEVSRLTLEQYEKQLDDAIVTAPISGTVTAVYAEEGATPTGLLFIIEDTDKLKIETTVKEYDLPSVAVGQKVEIKSDGIGDRVVTGKVSKIAPTAVKASAGAAAGSSVEFAVEIAVDEPHEGLLIGMKARVSIILQEADNVYGIPYDAVLTDPDGSSYIFAAEAGERGYTAKRVPVEVGMESDFYVEISGSELTDGMLIITNPTGISEGMPVPVASSEGV